MTKRIYVVTPKKAHFDNWCRDNGRHPNERDLVHVRQPLTLLGRYIRADDEVHYSRAHEFDQEVLHQIQTEISIRSAKS